MESVFILFHMITIGCHIRSVVVNRLIYLDAKCDGRVITPVQRHSLYPVSAHD